MDLVANVLEHRICLGLLCENILVICCIWNFQQWKDIGCCIYFVLPCLLCFSLCFVMPPLGPQNPFLWIHQIQVQRNNFQCAVIDGILLNINNKYLCTNTLRHEVHFSCW
jgi:hypothetical protein